MKFRRQILTVTMLALSVLCFAQAPVNLDSIESSLKGTLSDSLRIRVLISLSKNYQHLDHRKAKSNAEQALAISQKANWPWALHECYRHLGLLSSLSGDFSTALEYDNSNLTLSIERTDSAAIAEALNFVGNDYTELGKYNEAYYYFTQSHRIAKAVNDSLMMDISLHNLGAVFKELGQYELALQYFKIAGEIGEKINDEDGPAYKLDEEADVYLRIRDFKKARETLEESIRVIRKRKLLVVENRTMTKFAKLFFELGEYEKSLAYYDSVSAQHEKTDNEFGLAEANLGKSKVYVAQGKIAEAETLAKQTLSVAHALNANKLETECFELLSQLAEKKGDYRNALNYFKSYKAVEDSLFSQEMMQNLYQRQLSFATENKDSEIALLSEVTARQDTRLQRQELLSNILAVVVALSVILLFTVYRSGQRRIRINKLLMEHQAEIKRRSVELEQLNQVKDKFFSIISHDLRSPINALAAILDLAEKKHLEPQEFAQLTKELRVQFNHTKSLINNLLDWTLLQMDKLKIQEDKIDLHHMVEGNFKLFDVVNLKETQMVNEVEPGTFVRADTNMINLVFRNLILNAVKFTEQKGLIKVKSKIEGGSILISVTDNGVGIQPEVQKILFEKTSGYSTRGTANEKGTGLGLILCKDFVERNGGKIWLESELGKGSTFYFTLKKA